MINLSKTQSENIPIIITNQILSHDDTNYQRMHAQLENYIHQKIYLEKIKNKNTCKFLLHLFITQNLIIK